MLVVFSSALMTLDHRQGFLSDIRSAISVIVYPIQALVSLPVSASGWLGENLSSREALMEENGALRSQNIFLKAQLQKFVSLEIENMRLRKLLQASERINDRVLAAELLSVDLDPFSHQVVVNKGLRHDIYNGQPVLDAEGVYGQVVHAMPLTSQIMLITDPAHALPVQFNRNGIRTIAVGTGAMDKLELLHIPNNSDVQVGDVLVTSGLGGVFPVGYPVAEVIEFEPIVSQPYAKVFARPLAMLDRSREVMLVWHQERVDLIAAQKAAEEQALQLEEEKKRKKEQAKRDEKAKPKAKPKPEPRPEPEPEIDPVPEDVIESEIDVQP